MPLTIVTNAPDAAALLEKINTAIAAAYPQLYGQLGRVFQQRVQDRISSQDSGRWADASKWVRAKKGDGHKILDGAGEYVKYRATGKGLELYGDVPGEWTLTMHDQGFENKIEQPGTDGKVEIDIINPGPLGLNAGTSKFSWYPRTITPDKTPARKIWDTEQEVVQVATPIYSRWLQATVNRAIQGTGASVTGSTF